MKRPFYTFFVFAVTLISFSARAQTITTVAGNDTAGYSGDGSAATGARLNYPYGVAADASGNLYISDVSNNVIRRISASGIITTVVGNGTPGNGGDGGQATAANLNYPYGLAVDASGNLYISDDVDNIIRKVSTSGIISRVAGNGAPGYTGDGGAATSAELNQPIGVAVDAAGNLYIADKANQVVRKVNTAGIITTVAGIGDNPGYSGDGGAATLAQLNQPIEITVDASGNLYIADYRNYAIRVVNGSGTISTLAGNGVPGYTGDGGAAISAELNTPIGITFDPVGNLYIADNVDNVIRMINTSGNIKTVAGNGTAGFIGDNGPAIAAELHGPVGIAFDPVGNMYIADAGNNVIRKVNIGPNGVKQVGTTNYNITVLPNPNNGQFIVAGTLNTIADESVSLIVTDVLGRIVYQNTIVASSGNINTQVNLNNAVGGVYLLQVRSASATNTCRLLIEK